MAPGGPHAAARSVQGRRAQRRPNPVLALAAVGAEPIHYPDGRPGTEQLKTIERDLPDAPIDIDTEPPDAMKTLGELRGWSAVETETQWRRSVDARKQQEDMIATRVRAGVRL
jgi:hypothetical protein